MRPGIQQTGGLQGAPLSAAIPLADGVADTQRIGSAGAVGEAADAGHIHPIARLAQLALPAIAVGGQTLVGQVVWQQYTTEETQEFTVRVHVRPTAAGAWRTIVFPSLAGYQTPQVALQGLYWPAGLGANAWPGQHFLWGGTTFYHAATAAQVNQDLYWNFRLSYMLT